MPEYASSGDKPSRRSQRPIFEHAAEVTKKSGAIKEEELEKPPTFQGRKIAGAKNFLSQAQVSERVADQSEEHATLSSLPGAEAAARSEVTADRIGSAAVHPLAAPTGSRRFWGRVFGDLVDHPDTHISKVCKAGYDEGVPFMCEPLMRRPYEGGDDFGYQRCTAHGPTLHLITYQMPLVSGSYVFRSLDRRYKEAQDAGLALPTSSDFFCRDVDTKMLQLAPPKEALDDSKSSTEGTKTSFEDTGSSAGYAPSSTSGIATSYTGSTSASKPTYSDVRESYHELKEWAKRAPKPKYSSNSGIDYDATYARNVAARPGDDIKLGDGRVIRIGPDYTTTVIRDPYDKSRAGSEPNICHSSEDSELDTDPDEPMPDWSVPILQGTSLPSSRHKRSRRVMLSGLTDEDQEAAERERVRRQQEFESARETSQLRLRSLRMEQARKSPRFRKRLQKEMTILCCCEIRDIIASAIASSDSRGDRMDTA